jgi:hypothetical protein
MSTNDPEFYQAPKFTPEPPQELPKQRGCFFYGCIIASILAVLLALLLAVAAFFAWRAFNQMIDQYTSTTPLELPKVEVPAEKRQALKDHIEEFRKAVEAGNPTEPLVLTADDVNALIDENEELKGKVFVKIEGEDVKGKVSIPLDKFGLSVLNGRYLNGEADLKASLSDGVLIVTLEGIEVNGKSPPEEVMKGIREQNLAKDAYKDEKTSSMLRKLESLEIKDGKIILRVRAKPAASGGGTDMKKEEPVQIVPNGTPKDGAEKKAEPPAPKVEAPAAQEKATPKS